MRWRVFKVASVLSLVLSLGTLVLSAWSDRVAEVVIVPITLRWELGFCLQPGTLGVCVAHSKGQPPFVGKYRRREIGRHLTGRSNWIPEFLGWSNNPSRGVRTDRWGYEWMASRSPVVHSLFVECWFITPKYWKLECLSAIPPVVWVIRVVQMRSKIKRGHCTTCNYNLTGNESGACPECGTVIKHA